MKTKVVNFYGNLKGKAADVKWGHLVWSVIRAVLVIGISFIIIRPILTKIALSFMTARDLIDISVRWIPKNFTLENYVRAFVAMEYPVAFKNSFFLAFSVSILQLISSTVVGYGFARFNFKIINYIFPLVILSLIIPPQVIMTPMYLNFRFFNIFGLFGEDGISLINTFWPFILTSLTATGFRNGLFIYIMRQFFRGMPSQLEEAAYVDGAGPFKTFFKVMLPGILPAALVVFLFSFVWQWNDIFYISLFTPRKTLLSFTLTSGFIRHFQSIYGETLTVLEESQEYSSALANTGMLLFIAPLLILYGFLQRHFVESVERTGIVG